MKVSLVFEQTYNESLIHQAIVAYQAGARASTKKQKTRSEVSGGGRKPFRQKGTGRARTGTIRNPLWRGGGIIFAARTNQNHRKGLNKKAYRVALRSILSELARQKRLTVIESLNLTKPNTKALIKVLSDTGLDLAKKILLIDGDISANVYLSSRNLTTVAYCDSAHMSPVDLVSYHQVVITQSALKKIEEWLAL